MFAFLYFTLVIYTANVGRRCIPIYIYYLFKIYFVIKENV